MTDLHTDDRDDPGAEHPAAPTQPDKDRLGANFYKLFTGTVVSNLGDGIGTVAYPWLASAITRNPILVALVAVAQRLPWLLFTLPAGVITDRVDRRKAMVSMDIAARGRSRSGSPSPSSAPRVRCRARTRSTRSPAHAGDCSR
jgi:hypothetical protein